MRMDFRYIKPNEKQEHIKELWRLCYLKSVGSSQILRVFDKLHQRIINYGTTRNINNSSQDAEKKILDRKSEFVRMPDDTIKKVWNILMIFPLMYVATWVPVNICF